MRWLTFELQREPGFRLNLTDLLLLAAVAGVSAAWRAVTAEQHLYLLPLYVAGSFFLFCNVFRVGNRMELPWYLTFTALAGYGLTRPEFPWAALLLVCEPLKWALIAYRVVRGPYHGAFASFVEARRASRARGNNSGPSLV